MKDEYPTLALDSFAPCKTRDWLIRILFQAVWGMFLLLDPRFYVVIQTYEKSSPSTVCELGFALGYKIEATPE
jgi:hypothetical protein